jgi:iron complex transport system permease protein
MMPQSFPAARHGPRRISAYAVAALLLTVVASLFLGQYPVTPADLIELLSGRGNATSPLAPVIFQIRLPRLAAALLVGASLAAAGALFQALFRNPLAAPDILGVATGSGLGAAFGIWLSLPAPAVQLAAFAGGLAAVAAVYILSGWVRGQEPTLVLVLVGVVVGALAGAGLSLLKYLADPHDQLPAITFWLMGSLSAVRPQDTALAALLVAAAIVPVWLLRWRVNLMALGDAEAAALGVEVRRLRLVLIACATLMTAAVVALAGVVGWVGLMVPHIARLLAGPNLARVLPVAMFVGAGFLLVVDDIARSVGSVEIPLGVLTAALGAPFFLYLLARSGHAGRG